ncbi:MAG TPA: DIP1984 family protein [Mycobacteriales bacterium]|nr:DIP1984 family protein [Mycobacteriales bacterium]
MKLAEALALRSDAVKRVEQLRARVQTNARYQEGEEPTEDANALLAEAGRVLDQLEDLIRRVNRTNATATVEDGMTLTDALARRDVLRLRHAFWSRAADAASGRESSSGGFRQLRSELRTLPALPVRELRTAVDELAREHRELDVKIQRANWQADLVD